MKKPYSIFSPRIHWAVIAVTLFLIYSSGVSPLFAQQKDVHIHVTSELMQEFFGLGFSIHSAKGYFYPSNASVRNKLYSETFSGFNTISFWSYIENPATRDQVIAEAKKHGLKRIIVNPTGYPESPIHHANQQFKDITEYLDAGYPIYGTTIMNKPNTDESDTHRQEPAFLAESARLLRAKLDSAGLERIRIGGPSTVEWSPYVDPTNHGASHGYSFQPGDNMAYLQGLIDDTLALNALSAFDFQSYGWSVSKDVQELAKLHNKELWVSLSATDGENNRNGDAILSPVSAANCLANINHGVSHWNYWVWDQLANFSTGDLNRRGKTLQQIGKTFQMGAIVRRCVSEPYNSTPEMAWSFFDYANPSQNKQPEIVAAAAKNADQSFVVCMVNLTGVHAQHFLTRPFPEEATDMAVRVILEETAPNEVGLFSISRTNADGITTHLGEVLMKHNHMQVVVASQDLLTLKADSLFASSQVMLREYAPMLYVSPAKSAATVELFWSDNSPNETGFIIERRIEGTEAFSPVDTVDANVTSFVDIPPLAESTAVEYKVSALSYIEVGAQLFPDTVSSNIVAVAVDVTGLDQLSAANVGFDIYPNPSGGMFRIYSEQSNDMVDLAVYTMNGTKVLQQRVAINEEISMAGLREGVYYVRIGGLENFVIRKLVLVR